jgi:hypothetical protein
MINLDYKTKVNIKREKAYNEIRGFIKKIAIQEREYNEGVVYFLDGSREEVIRANFNNKTFELTDKVEEWIFNSINELNKKQ